MRPKKKSSKDLEDLSGISGWMYSDLLIALMVIFLATITFVPEVYGSLVRGSSTPSNNEKPVYNYFEYYDKPLVKVYNGFNIDYIKQDIDNFLITENLISGITSVTFSGITSSNGSIVISESDVNLFTTWAYLMNQ